MSVFYFVILRCRLVGIYAPLIRSQHMALYKCALTD